MLGSFSQFFLDLYESNPKWNFIYFYDPKQADRILEGLWTTLELSVVCVIFSVVIGVAGAWLQTLPNRLFGWWSRATSSFSETPLL